MACKRKLEVHCLQSDDSTVCFSTSSDTETASEVDDQEVGQIISLFGKEEKIPVKKIKSSGPEEDIQVLEVEEGPVEWEVEIVRVELNSSPQREVEVIEVIPPPRKGMY